MRTKTIIPGFKNSQRIRFILRANSGEEFGMYLTIQQMTNSIATTDARVAIWTTLEKLAANRRVAQSTGQPLPTGLLTDVAGFQQIQVDLVNAKNYTA